MSTPTSPTADKATAAPSTCSLLTLTPKRGSIPFTKLRGKVAQRRAIAMDVLDQLRLKRMTATSGVFLSLKLTDDTKTASIEGLVNDGVSVKDLLAGLPVAPTCEACALGGLLLSQLRVNGDCEAGDLDASGRTGWACSYRPDIHLSPLVDGCADQGFSPFILQYFSAEQLQLIEMAFEMGEGAFSCADDVDAWVDAKASGDTYMVSDARDSYTALDRLPSIGNAAKAIALGRRYEDDDKRLAAIMRRIVKHDKALFVP